MKKLITIVDDEPDVLEMVSYYLKEIGFAVRECSTAAQLMDYLQVGKPDLIILDLKLPDADGLEICKRLKGNRSLSYIPIIILTGRGHETDRILGLELGADDYVTKPFSPRELVTRVKVVLKRAVRKESGEIIKIGNLLEIHVKQCRVFVEGKEIYLTTTEFRILALLSEQKGWVLARKQILDSLWNNDKIVVDRVIDVHIKNLKKKLGKANKLIKSVRGIGYKLED